MKKVAVLIAIGVDRGAPRSTGRGGGDEGGRGELAELPAELKERGLVGVRLFITDKCLELVESLAEFYPTRRGSAAWCTGTAA